MFAFRLIVCILLAVLVSPAAAQTSAPLSPGFHDVVINGVRLSYRVAGQKHGTPVARLNRRWKW